MSHYDELYEQDRQASAVICRDKLLKILKSKVTADNVDSVAFIVNNIDRFIGLVELFKK